MQTGCLLSYNCKILVFKCFLNQQPVVTLVFDENAHLSGENFSVRIPLVKGYVYLLIKVWVFVRNECRVSRVTHPAVQRNVHP